MSNDKDFGIGCFFILLGIAAVILALNFRFV
jgi:hypothetical protein